MAVDILLAAYNSERFLEVQIDSLINQTYKDWRLIIRDDASSDSTAEIIKKYAIKYPNKIFLHIADKNFGAKENFNKLLSLAESQYVMFCDHDDFWLPDKIEITLKKMLETEKEAPKETPILVFTDKSITDENLKIICKSSSKCEKLNVKNIKARRLLVQNVASGCTIMINRQLLLLCVSIPQEAVMHDHYMMLLAAFFGRIGYVDTPSILYRQHSQNEIGAQACDSKYFLKKLKDTPSKIKERFMKNVYQGEKILAKYGDNMPQDKKRLLQEFVMLKTANRLEFATIIIKNGFYKSGFVRKLGMLALLF